jgi:serine/threonine protein kinase
MTTLVFKTGINPQVEEFPDVYWTRGFHSVYVGDVYSHYRVVRKLGHGAYSTVWLAEDLQ